MTSPSPRRLVALMASHNRCATTLRALDSIAAQPLPSEWSLTVLLVDDGSTDGTPEQVAARHPDVTILHGSGDLYWNRAMRLGFETAKRGNFDACVWLNDDVVLSRDAISRLLGAAAEIEARDPRPFVAVGSVSSRDGRSTTYGGWRLPSRGPRLRLVRVEPEDELTACDTFNANCVLVSAAAARLVGNLDAVFTQVMGDIDFGLRLRRSGGAVWLAPGYFGICELNREASLWRDPAVPFRARWARLRGPKGLPFREWSVFTRRHAGGLWPLYFVSPYLECLLAPLKRSRARSSES